MRPDAARRVDAHVAPMAGMSASTALSQLTLEALLRRGARDQPGALALRGSMRTEIWSFCALDAHVDSVATRLQELELDAGACVLITGAASPHVLIATIAAQRAGLRVALAPLAFGREDLASACLASAAVALIGAGGPSFGDIVGLLTAVAIQAPQIRLVATCGDEGGSGCVDLDAPGTTASFDEIAGSDIFTFARAAAGLIAVPQTPAKLAASALLLQQTLPDDGWPVLSTLPPVTLAGIVCGPMAAWLAGCGLLLHGPFDSAAFQQARVEAGRAHIMAPASLGPSLLDSSFPGSKSLDLNTSMQTFASLTLLHRHADSASIAAARPQILPGNDTVPLIDLLAIGETCAAALRRDGQHHPALVAGTTRHIHIAGMTELAFAARHADAGRLDMRGAVFEQGENWRVL